MYEIQADNILANDGAQGAGPEPPSLRPEADRARPVAGLMKADGTGPGIMWAAAGLYFRGVRSTNGTAEGDGISLQRIPGQRRLHRESDSGTDGIHLRYCSAPHWKTTSDFGLWHPGRLVTTPRTTTLDSIRVSDPPATRTRLWTRDDGDGEAVDAHNAPVPFV